MHNYEILYEKLAEYISDDYQFVDSAGNVLLDKEGWFAMAFMIMASVPDLDFVTTEIHQEGEDVVFTGYFTGTFKHDLDLSVMNMGVIPATGKALNFPDNTSRYSFTGDRISKNQLLITDPNAGTVGLLAAFSAD